MTNARPEGPRGRPTSSPHETTADLRRQLVHTQRELSITRRYLHRVQREQGLELTKYFAMPRYGKLEHRPLILGFGPSSGARSGLPFDDEHGDNMCEVFGLSGFQHLLNNFKIRNVFLHPADDLLHVDRGREAMDRAIANHAARHLFAGRVVIIVGQDARRACRIDPAFEEIGFIDPAVLPGAPGAVLLVPDIGHPRSWDRARREKLWLVLAIAMMAARLPCDDVMSVARSVVAGEEMPAVWRSLPGGEAWPFPGLASIARGLDLWMTLAAVGLAAPPNLTKGAWMPTDAGSFRMHATGGFAMLTGTSARAEVRVFEYSAKAGPSFYAAGRRGDCRRMAEEYMFDRRDWDHPFRAVDERLKAGAA